MRKYTFRSLLCLAMCLALFAAPLLSEARYRAYLNSFAAVVAKEYYFSSNYLKEGGAKYTINGWNGLTIKMDDIDIRNYDNTLLANQSGQDLYYIVDWKVDVYDAEDNPITDLEKPFFLTVTHEESTYSPGETNKRVPKIEYKDENGVTGSISCKIPGDGNSKRDKFSLTLVSPFDADSTLENGCYVEVSLTATNVNDRNQYSRTINCIIRYTISELENFVREFHITDDGKTVETKISTNTIPGSDNIQKVYLWWDTSVLEVNRFNHQFNQLYLEKKYTEVESEDKSRTFGLLEISASSLSSRTLQFKKLKLQEEDFSDDSAYVCPGVGYMDAEADNYLGYYMETVTQTPG